MHRYTRIPIRSLGQFYSTEYFRLLLACDSPMHVLLVCILRHLKYFLLPFSILEQSNCIHICVIFI